jgi:hypothetical protein
MKQLSAAILFALAALTPFALSACDDIDQAFDCAQICQRYDDCVDSDYDVDGCTDRCETNADESDDFADQADACESCLDDRTCSGIFPCIDECIGVVP